jgi:putative MFS transporter
MPGTAQKSAELVGRLERLPFSRWHRNLFILCFIGVMFDACDFALFGFALPLVRREFGLDQAQGGLLVTVGLVGAFLGALFWGTISDYIGRRTSFSATVGIFSVFTGLVASAGSVLTLGIYRFISNFGLGGEVPVALTLTAEFSPGRIRGRMTGVMMAGFPLGLALAAALSYFIIPVYGWRALFVIGIVPAVLLFFVRLVMPESVRYLLSRGRVAEAEATVARIETQALAAAPAPAASVAAAVAAEERGVTVFELLTPERRRRTILLWIVSFGFLWSSNGLIFMLPNILVQRGLELRQIFLLVFVQAMTAFVGYAACGFLIDRFGRRPVLFLYYFVGAFFHWWLADATGVMLFFAIAAVGWVNPGVYGANGIYVSELYPTHLRATAVGWFFGIGRIGSFLVPTVAGYMLQYGYGAYVLHTFALSYLISAIALWFVGIETKGKVLEQITGAEAKA